MLVHKFDKHVQEKLKMIVAEEVELKLREKDQIKNERDNSKPKSKFSMFNKLATPLKQTIERNRKEKSPKPFKDRGFVDPESKE